MFARPWNEARAAILVAPLTETAGGLLPALHAVQAEFGFVPEPAIRLLATMFNLTRADVFGVASFYHDFRLHEPPGRHVLRLCRAEACQAVGAAKVARKAKQTLGIDWGGTTADGAWSLEQVFCLGLCASGPAAIVDGELVAKLDADKLETLLDRGDAE